MPVFGRTIFQIVPAIWKIALRGITIGLGALDTGFAGFGEVVDLKTRAELVDEGLQIIKALWQGKPFDYKGKHYTLDLTSHEIKVPAPLQKPRPPIWMVAAWPRPKSMQRVLHCDGIIPIVKPKDSAERSVRPDDILEIKAWIEAKHDARKPTRLILSSKAKHLATILKALKPLPIPGRKLAQRGGLNQSGAILQHGKNVCGKDPLLFHSERVLCPANSN